MKKSYKQAWSAVFALLLALALAGCAAAPAAVPTVTPADAATDSPADTESPLTVLKVGASPAPHAEILRFIQPLLREQGIDLQVVEFDDYVLPNTAVNSGELDANFFQHLPYLLDFNSKNGTELTSVVAVHVEPLGIYAGKSADLANIPEGAVIAVPNDTTNEARALLLLQAQGIITLKDGVGLEATVQDIQDNPKNVSIQELEAAQVPRVLADVDFAVANGNYAISAGVTDKLLTTEDRDSEGAQKYANVLVVRTGNENRAEIQALADALTSQQVKDYITQTYGKFVVPQA
ncbi:MAG: MetQ/NlpA family ABC transporter substrate-binding protein [Eubacteriales bacterium]|nr:MetQ/NlpA family ABC transporter substrate-binding protein [Eubacteriales bacterium]